MSDTQSRFLTRITLSTVDPLDFLAGLEWIEALMKRQGHSDQRTTRQAICRSYLRLRMLDFAENFIDSDITADPAVKSMYNWLRNDIPGNNPVATVTYAHSYRAAGAHDRAGLLEARAAGKYFLRGDFRSTASRLEVAVCDFAAVDHTDLQRRHLDLAHKIEMIIEGIEDHKVALATWRPEAPLPLLEQATG